MHKNILIVGIIILYILSALAPITFGSNVRVSDMKKIIKNTNIINDFDCSEELSIRGHIAYAFCEVLGPHGEGPCKFDLDNPEDIEQLSNEVLPAFPAGGTWTSDDRWLVSLYSTGRIYEIDTDDGEITYIGSGDVELTGLAWDYITYALYGTSGSTLYEIDPDDGSQITIGSHVTTTMMNGITCDNEGTCFGVDIDYNRKTYSNLYTINISTGKATLVGPLINCTYAVDAAYNKDNETLYLMGDGLYICDSETGECIRVECENFPELTGFAIPEVNLPPIAVFNWTPTFPDPGETILFNASDSYDPDGYIKLYEWDWDNDGEYDYKNYTSPIATHIFEEAGKYPVTLRVHDHTFSNATITKIVRVGNQPPDTPVIEGKRKFREGEGGRYPYTIYSIDPDGDALMYLINWSDGIQEWIGPFLSGEKFTIDAIIPLEKGKYELFKVKAMDGLGVSDWAILEIIVPRTRETYNSLLLRFLEPFPLLERLLSILGWNIL